MKVRLNDYAPNDFIRIIREWTETTQKQFANRIGKGERTVHAYESGSYNYNIKTLKKICDEFNIEIIAIKK